MATAEVKSLYQKLVAEWEKKDKNLATIQQLLDSLKVAFLDLPFMPTSVNEGEKMDLMIIQRDVLELAALYAVEAKDIPAFERTISQLKFYYSELSSLDANVAPSSRKYMMIGLNLLRLLAQNKVAEFHMELELLPVETFAKDVYIGHSVQLEQWLMEGRYNKIFLSKVNVPAPCYNFFMDILLDTVRDEIGICMEKSYDGLSLDEAARMLFFKTPGSQMQAYVQKRGWKLSSDGKRYMFQNLSAAKPEETVVPAEKLARNNIFYAKQLEMIV